MKYRDHYIKNKSNCALSIQDIQFLKWIDIVEALVRKELCVFLLDLPDMPYYTSFEENLSPESMGKLVIREFNLVN